MEGRRTKKSNSVKQPKTDKSKLMKNEKANHKRKDSHTLTNAQNFANKIINNVSPIINFKSKPEATNELQLQKEEDLSIDILKKEYPRYEEGEMSQKHFGIIKSYAFNSYHGLLKDDNEDKIAVCVGIKKPHNCKLKTWPKISYFAIFDGHGGDKCSIYLRDNLLNFILEDKNFPIDVKQSLISAVERAENEFNQQFKNLTPDDLNKYNEKTDFSGSCVLVCLIVDNKIFLCNIGDSRAIMSMENGSKIRPLTIDHKPNNPKEFERIIKSGCKVYIDNDDPFRDINKVTIIQNEKEFDKYTNDVDVIYRIYPCDLSVSRTIGDPKSKFKNLGGIPNQIISTPEIFIFENNNLCDFIILGCDGIFDMLKNNEIIDCAWFAIQNTDKERRTDINLVSLDVCNMIIKNSMDKLSGDNLSVIVIGLEGLEKFINNKVLKQKVGNMFKEHKK
jgi:protein phosphatase 2C family protein 2/3